MVFSIHFCSKLVNIFGVQNLKQNQISVKQNKKSQFLVFLMIKIGQNLSFFESKFKTKSFCQFLCHFYKN